MPPKRTTRASTARNSGQGVLSFGSNKITKPTTSPRSVKGKRQPSLVATELKDDAPAATPPTRQRGPPAAADPLTTGPSSDVKTEDILGGRATPEPEADETEADAEEVADDQAALNLPVSRVKTYWREKEGARLAPRVHQDQLPLSEKILREWDMSGQYGPCIGIGRVRRWRRARKLGLEPPVEVLSVLLGRLDGEERKGKKSGGEDGGERERAYVDLLMGNRLVAV